MGRRRQVRRVSAVIAWVLVLISLPALCVWSSHKRVTVTLVACNRATVEPEAGAVHPYPGGPPPDRLSGELCEVWFTTDVALESLTRLTHHHYFTLRPCGYTGDVGYFWSGSIYAARPSDYASRPGVTNLYRGYFPLSLSRLRERIGGFGLDVEQSIELARQRGLCMRVGGGQMWGWVLSSNDMRLPVEVTTADALVLNGGK